MVPRKLSQIYRQYPCSVLSSFAILYETRSYQHNYFKYYRPSNILLFTLIADYVNVICLSLKQLLYSREMHY